MVHFESCVHCLSKHTVYRMSFSLKNGFPHIQCYADIIDRLIDQFRPETTSLGDAAERDNGSYL